VDNLLVNHPGSQPVSLLTNQVVSLRTSPRLSRPISRPGNLPGSRLTSRQVSQVDNLLVNHPGSQPVSLLTNQVVSLRTSPRLSRPISRPGNLPGSRLTNHPGSRPISRQTNQVAFLQGNLLQLFTWIIHRISGILQYAKMMRLEVLDCMLQWSIRVLCIVGNMSILVQRLTLFLYGI
jgi:hypothetical protein